MNAAARERHLRALDIEPLRLRRIAASAANPVADVAVVTVDGDAAPPPIAPPSPVPQGFRKLALQPDNVELGVPAIRAMYSALTEAVGKAGLQRVRVCDVVGDPEALVMVFGAAPLPEGIPAIRVLRVDPLSVLLADRERKRLLWEQMQALGRGAG